MSIELTLQIAHSIKVVPHPSHIRCWVGCVLNEHLHICDAEVTIRIVDRKEITYLNHRYRNKNKPTNVLSFPGNIDLAFVKPFLGDVVICSDVVTEEAKNCNKPLMAHWAHIIIHGLLHLLGYDHEEHQDAIIMEKLEEKLLKCLGYPSPYK